MFFFRSMRLLAGICILAAVLSGCAGARQSTSMVFPSSVGMNATIDSVLDDPGSYHIYYCQAGYNPSALMFVPHSWKYEVVPERHGLGLGWQAVSDPQSVRKMQATILDRDRISNPVLRVLLTPVLPDGRREPLAFVYSIKSTSARGISGHTDAFLVLSIPEIPGKYGDDDLAPWKFFN